MTKEEKESLLREMEFSYKPINPFQDNGLSQEDKKMLDGMRNTAFVCGYRGDDVEFAVHETLKRMRRYDLLPPCERTQTGSKDDLNIVGDALIEDIKK